MKLINIIGIFCSIICMGLSVYEKDYTEAGAWFALSLSFIADLLQRELEIKP